MPSGSRRGFVWLFFIVSSLRGAGGWLPIAYTLLCTLSLFGVCRCFYILSPENRARNVVSLQNPCIVAVVNALGIKDRASCSHNLGQSIQDTMGYTGHHPVYHTSCITYTPDIPPLSFAYRNHVYTIPRTPVTPYYIHYILYIYIAPCLIHIPYIPHLQVYRAPPLVYHTPFFYHIPRSIVPHTHCIPYPSGIPHLQTYHTPVVYHTSLITFVP